MLLLALVNKRKKKKYTRAFLRDKTERPPESDEHVGRTCRGLLAVLAVFDYRCPPSVKEFAKNFARTIHL